MLGVQAGALVHVAAAALGLSTLLTSSATAFAVVRYAGAAYLVALGVQALRRRDAERARPRPAGASGRLFRQGLVVNVLNPKVAVFFLAFLPQFVDPTRGAVPVQIVLLGAIFVALAVLSDGLYAVVAGNVGDRLGRSVTLRRRLDRLSGGVLVALGGVTAVTGQRPRS
jgi:threonine/homoserine/homoserine lactone efflux protein